MTKQVPATRSVAASKFSKFLPRGALAANKFRKFLSRGALVASKFGQQVFPARTKQVLAAMGPSKTRTG